MMEKGSRSSTAEKMPRSQGCRASLAMAESLPPLLYHLLCYEPLAQYETRKGIQSMTMIIAVFFMRLFEVMFFAGVAGSAVVVVISFIEDIQLLVGD